VGRADTAGHQCLVHYTPLHTSDAGRRYVRTEGALPVTEASAERLIRLPLWPGMGETDIAQVIEGLASAVSPHSLQT
jgi:dTDP-4-amino-4,6-dideoxygalactose transaminase